MFNRGDIVYRPDHLTHYDGAGHMRVIESRHHYTDCVYVDGGVHVSQPTHTLALAELPLEPEQEAMTKDRSDAMAWREFMRSMNNVDDSAQEAWENWRERESWAGRANRAIGEGL